MAYIGSTTRKANIMNEDNLNSPENSLSVGSEDLSQTPPRMILSHGTPDSILKAQDVEEEASQDLPTIIIQPEKVSNWDMILEALERFHHTRGVQPTQEQLGRILKKSQAWISIQIRGMLAAGILEREAGSRYLKVSGVMRAPVPAINMIAIPERDGEIYHMINPLHLDVVPGMTHYIFQPEADSLLPAILKSGIQPDDWVLIRRQTMAGEKDIVAHYDKDWGVRLVEFGPAFVGKIEGKVVLVLRTRQDSQKG